MQEIMISTETRPAPWAAKKLRILVSIIAADFRTVAEKQHRKREMSDRQRVFVEDQVVYLGQSESFSELAKRISLFNRKLDTVKKMPMIFRSLANVYRVMISGMTHADR